MHIKKNVLFNITLLIQNINLNNIFLYIFFFDIHHLNICDVLITNMKINHKEKKNAAINFPLIDNAIPSINAIFLQYLYFLYKEKNVNSISY